jgi:hypothetical protein
VTSLRVEFHHPPRPTEPPEDAPAGKPPPPPPPEPAVATAEWRDGRVAVEADDPSLVEAIERAYRRTPVAVDDASLRYPSTTGESLLQPGDLEWFRAVALVRVPAETGLVPRFVPGAQVGGFDPAANYRSFREQVERLAARASD